MSHLKTGKRVKKSVGSCQACGFYGPRQRVVSPGSPWVDVLCVDCARFAREADAKRAAAGAV